VRGERFRNRSAASESEIYEEHEEQNCVAVARVPRPPTFGEGGREGLKEGLRSSVELG
jgi:hypothetical protein